jgi:hypothetical protein
MLLVQEMMQLGFEWTFQNIVIEWIFKRLKDVFALFSRERYSEQDIFGEIGKIIDFPKIVANLL